MQNRRGSRIKGLTRIGARIGVLLADPQLRSEIRELFTDRVSSMADAMSDRYEDVVHRVQGARDALRGRTNWRTRAAGFALGLGVGAGIGILLAPNSGSNTRQALRGQAAYVKNRVVQSASTVMRRSEKAMA